MKTTKTLEEIYNETLNRLFGLLEELKNITTAYREQKQTSTDQQAEAEKSKYNDLYNSIYSHYQTLIARNYNNIGVWSNERQQYNFQLISEVEELLKQHNKIKQP